MMYENIPEAQESSVNLSSYLKFREDVCCVWSTINYWKFYEQQEVPSAETKHVGNWVLITFLQGFRSIMLTICVLHCTTRKRGQDLLKLIQTTATGFFQFVLLKLTICGMLEFEEQLESNID